MWTSHFVRKWKQTIHIFMVGHRSTGLPECGPTESSAPEPCFYNIYNNSYIYLHSFSGRRKLKISFESYGYQDQYHRLFFKIQHQYNSYTAFNVQFFNYFFFFKFIIFLLRHLINRCLIRQIVPGNHTIQFISVIHWSYNNRQVSYQVMHPKVNSNLSTSHR